MAAPPRRSWRGTGGHAPPAQAKSSSPRSSAPRSATSAPPTKRSSRIVCRLGGTPAHDRARRAACGQHAATNPRRHIFRYLVFRLHGIVPLLGGASIEDGLAYFLRFLTATRIYGIRVSSKHTKCLRYTICAVNALRGVRATQIRYPIRQGEYCAIPCDFLAE